MTKAKNNEDFRWDDDKFPNNEEKDLPTLQLETAPSIDSVINAEFIEEGEHIILRLDLMSITGDDGRYYSLSYDLSKSTKINGLFDFLDDYYSKRFTIFSSNKNTQSLMVALYHLEKEFFRKTGYDFMDYCETVSSDSIDKISKDERFTNIVGMSLYDGYSIGNEASEFYHLKKNDTLNNSFMNDFGKKLMNDFNNMLKDIEKNKFCCVCILNTDKIPNSFLIDYVIGLPLIIYNMEFAELIMKTNFKEFIDSNLFKMVEIKELKVDLWAVLPEATIKQLTSIIGDDGELTIDYDDRTMDSTDIFIGKYKTLKFNKKSYKNEAGKHQTVIGYK